jgi:D-glycero-D-manno-heptose 1,7-bisphosphate phosphatase
VTATLRDVKLLIVDRDGVVARDPDGRSARTEGWQSLPGSAAAIARLVHGGWRVAMMADSGPLARGAIDMAGLNAMHGRILDEIEAAGGRVDAVVFVPPADAPARLEHAVASLVDALARLGATGADTVLVADTCADLEAGHAAGCRPVLVLSGHGCAAFDADRLPPGTVVRPDLSALAAELAP